MVPGFSVMDERQARESLAAARAGVLAEAAAAPASALAVALATVVRFVPAAGFNDLLVELVGHRNRLPRSGPATPASPRGLEALRTALLLEPGETPEAVAAAAMGSALDRDGLAGAARALAANGPQDQAQAERLHAALCATDASSGFACLKQAFLTAEGMPKADKSVMTLGLARRHPDCFAAMLGERDRIVGLAQRERAARLFLATAAVLRLAGSIVRRYEAEKRRMGRCDYDDLIVRTLGLLRGSAGAAWVLYKLDGGLDHILLDEAQDTSPEQWQIIGELAGEFFAGHGAREGVERTLFVVGDRKQSIYSFQGADPQSFDAMFAFFRDRIAAAGRGFAEVGLDHSFRSTQQILDAVDRVFANAAAQRGLTGAAGGMTAHHAIRARQPGRVEIWPLEAPGDAVPPAPWSAPVDHVDPQRPQVVLAEKIAATIAGWIDREPLAPRGRMVRPGDILVLVRRRSAFVEALLRALKRRNVPVAGADRLVLTRHIAIMDLMALARFALLPEDDLTLAALLKSPLLARDDERPFGEEDLFALAAGRRESLWEALEAKVRSGEPYAGALASLGRWRDEGESVRPFEFFARILGPGRGRLRLASRLGAEVNDPIDEFLRLALDYEREHAPTLEGFVAWTSAAEAEVKRDMDHGTDEVRIMTVHGAKGLEANIVVLPDTCSVPDGRQDPAILFLSDGTAPNRDLPLWRIRKDFETAAVAGLRQRQRDRQREEYNRLLYVAMTRARDRLYVCGWHGRRGPDDGCWYDLIHDALAPAAQALQGADGKTLCWRLEGCDAPAPAEDSVPDAPPAAVREPPAWACRKAPPEADPVHFLAPSRLAARDEEAGAAAPAEEPAVTSPLAAERDLRFRRGNLVHRLLQLLPPLAPAERPPAARRFLARPAHRLPEDEQAAICAEVMAVLDHPAFAPLFAPGSLAEVPLIGRLRIGADGAEVGIAGQVDRLAVTEREVLIVDYKTNRPAPQSLDGVPPPYLRQIAAYRVALQALYPDKRVRTLLLWTDGPALMEVPADSSRRLATAPSEPFRHHELPTSA